jgi:amino acid adenylation domain-containing protein
MLMGDRRSESSVEMEPDASVERGWDIISLFDAQVRRAPGATALVSGSEKLTYQELSRRADQCARRLAALGVTERSFVGICIERSFGAIVGALAILKCGAAYVPVDHQYPGERIRFMLQDAGVVATLTRSTMGPEVLRELVRPVHIDEASDFDHHQEPGLPAELASSSSAYVMYTSGTCGVPKGAEIPHSGVTRLVWRSNYLQLDSTDVLLHHSTCSFDAATFEIWAALLNGCTLVLYPRPTLDLDALGSVIRSHGVTTLLLTTSVFHLVAEQRLESLGPLKQLVIGGDVLQAKAVKKALRRHPHLRIINGYGPTENTTFTCCHVITRETELGETVPIGKAISGTNVFVLDADLRRVQVGEVGELYTNGLGMAKGYVKRDALTRERFVTCPFPETGPVFYKTGDLVRQDPDGNLHFIGRADNQVKIRGFRIEPGEVEHALNLRPDVADTVVLAETAASGEKYLAAYVKVADPRSGLDARDVRRYLAARLPPYMVPTAIHLVEEFPLTHNGKVDRRRLRALQPRGAVEEPREEPRNPAELILDTWRRQLDAPSLQMDDSIYDFGASSLTVMVVQSRLNEWFHRAVDSTELAEAQTPLEWARVYAAPDLKSGQADEESPRERAGDQEGERAKA